MERPLERVGVSSIRFDPELAVKLFVVESSG
jgi:hypothetical protein